MRITVKQAAERLECQERIVQGMVRAGYFGAYIKGAGNQRGTYYMTDEQVETLADDLLNELRTLRQSVEARSDKFLDTMAKLQNSVKQIESTVEALENQNATP